MSAVKIVIVDDHPLFRGALSQALSASFTDADIGEAGSLDELTQRLETDKDVDLVLLDLSMPGVQGLSGLLFLRAQHPEIPVVVVSANEDPTTIRRCIEFGASGFVPKSEPVEEYPQCRALRHRRRDLDAQGYRSHRRRRSYDR